MSRRRQDLKALFAGEPGSEQFAQEPVVLRSASPSPAAETDSPIPASAAQPRASSGALKAMGLELDGLRQAASETERLRAQLASSVAVVEIDCNLVDAAFVRDRMSGDAEADMELEASIAANGQQVPVLLRPHPLAPGRYEAVYGHRRVAALKRLGRPVRAIVRPMSDDELVIAQGQENNQRRDLSFIERARFAALLAARGFPRSTIMAALDAHKADLTRYIGITEAVPIALIDAIGPAPATGRPRWLTLARLMPAAGVMPSQLSELIESEDFRARPSDGRFKAVLEALQERTPRGQSVGDGPALWRSADGRISIEQRKRSRTSVEMKLSGPEGAAFAEFVSGRLDRLLLEFTQESQHSRATPVIRAEEQKPQ